MNEKKSCRTNVKVGALVLTPDVIAIKNWLERYFGFETAIDWLQEDGAGGKVYCRAGEEEVAVMGCSNLSDGWPHSAYVRLLVDDIEQLIEAFDADDVDYSFSADIGERPTIEFYRPSPYFMFSIQQR